jgi:hypothetical protein
MAWSTNGCSGSVTAGQARFSAPSLTVAAWLNPVASDLNGALHGVLTCRNGGTYICIFGTFTGGAVSLFYNNGPNLTSGTLTAGTWFHCAVTISAAAVHTYVNGVIKGTAAGLSNIGGTAGVNTFTEPQNSAWSGSVQDLTYWKSALSLAEIQQLAWGLKRPTDIRYGDIVASWPCEGKADTVYQMDASEWISGGGSGTRLQLSGTPVVVPPPPFLRGELAQTRFRATRMGVGASKFVQNVPSWLPMQAGSAAVSTDVIGPIFDYMDPLAA